MIAYNGPALLDARDTGWVATVVAAASASAGQPWHVLSDRIDSLAARIGEPTTNPGTDVSKPRLRALSAVTGVMRRMLSSRPKKISPRDIREVVLGSPALDDASRTARIAAAGIRFDLTPNAIEQLMWSDLARDRIVTVPATPIEPLDVAARANVDLIERLIRRALHVKLVVDGDPRKFARIVARRGLLAKIETGLSPDETVFSIVGPLALFHATTVYGKAIASVVPYLAAQRFRLEVCLDYGRGEGTVDIASPILLPAPPTTDPPTMATKLAKDLAALDPTLAIDRAPPPIERDGRRMFPDLAVATRPIEIIGFATDEFLADKLATYRGAKLRPILCVDTARTPIAAGDDIVPFASKIDASAVLKAIRRPEERPRPAAKKRAATKSPSR